MPVVTSNICSVVALGADDCSVSVWQTKSARPLIVAKEVFERQIMDLSWYTPFIYEENTFLIVDQVLGWSHTLCSFVGWYTSCLRLR